MSLVSFENLLKFSLLISVLINCIVPKLLINFATPNQIKPPNKKTGVPKPKSKHHTQQNIKNNMQDKTKLVFFKRFNVSWFSLIIS